MLLGFLAASVSAQDLAGQWQGTLKAGQQGLRLILEIEKASAGGWTAAMYPIDEGPDAIPVTSVSLEGSDFKYTVDALQGIYEGKIGPDGTPIAGNWRQGKGRPLPLDLQRATIQTAWTLPQHHKVQFVTVDTDVKLEVLDWGGAGRPLVFAGGPGRHGACV